MALLSGIRKPMRRQIFLKNVFGQTLLEFVILFIVVIAALLTMKNYMQRGIQGKWRETVDGLGSQYDPAGNVKKISTTQTNAQTIINVEDQPGGYRTWRTDIMNILENTTESVNIFQ